MTIAATTKIKPATAVIEASKCCDQVHCSSTSAPLGKSVNGATATQPTKNQPSAR